MKSRGREGIVGVGGKIQTEARAGPLLRAVTTALPGLETKTEPKEPKGVTKRTERGVGPVHPGPEGAARCSLPGGPGPGGRRRLRAGVLWPRVLWGGARPPARLTPKWTEVSCVWVCDAVGGQQGDPEGPGKGRGCSELVCPCPTGRPALLVWVRRATSCTRVDRNRLRLHARVHTSVTPSLSPLGLSPELLNASPGVSVRVCAWPCGVSAEPRVALPVPQW